MESILSGGQRVLLTWGEGQDPEGIKRAVERLSAALGQNGKLQVENIERLALGKIYFIGKLYLWFLEPLGLLRPNKKTIM